LAEIFKYNKSIALESGYVLQNFHLAYTTYGILNEKKDNVIWIFHALTADSNPDDWWAGLVGEERLFDPTTYFIICVNMPGSCYGSISPLDNNPLNDEIFYHDFPLITIKDMVKMYGHLRSFLRIENIHIGLGGSMGGQQLLEWAVTEPNLFRYIIPIATNAFHSPWAIAFNASQRFAIETDDTWKLKNKTAAIAGMKVARSIALISYRSYETYCLSQSEADDKKIYDFKSESYQKYQGEKLAKRFNAFSYYCLSRSMDSHNLGRQRVSVIDALNQIIAKALVIGIRSDLLFPVPEQKFIAENVPGAVLEIIDSPYGHDGFLLEFSQIENIISKFISTKEHKIISEKAPG
jgi:homoserine O-acetyltransferase/O-succinyltransferase